MKDFFDYFTIAPLHLQGVMVLWLVCVTLFYGTLLMVFGNYISHTIKKRIK